MEQAINSAKERILGGLPPEKDPTSPHYVFHPEHERLAGISVSEITNPSLTPQLPAMVAYFTGMGGPFGRETFFIGAMRRRCELLGRPMTRVEMEVLGRYTQNMQTGTEYLGLFGISSAIYRGYTTGLWPLENFWKQALGIGTGQPPPSGFTIPTGFGQGSDPPSGTTSPHGTSPKQPAESIPKSASGGPWSRFWTEINKEPWVTKASSYSIEMLDKKLAQFPEAQRNSEEYKSLKSIRDFVAKVAEKNQYKPTGPTAFKGHLPELAEYLRQLDQGVADIKADTPEQERRLRMNYLKQKLDSFLNEAPEISAKRRAELLAGNLEELKRAHFESDCQEQILRRMKVMNNSPGLPIHTPPRADPLVQLKNIVRLSTWAVLGKYAFTAFGITILSVRSRGMEQRDERLQEYHHDRMENAKVILKEQIERARGNDPTRRTPSGVLGVPPSPQDTQADSPISDDDTQSLGGLQNETIFWGDTEKQTEEQGDPMRKPSQSAESPWARMKRGRDESAPSEVPDRYRATTAEPSGMNDTGNMSTWERIRQQSSSGAGSSGERSIPGESRQGRDSGGSGNAETDKQRAKEQAQKQFDEQLEKERRGGNDGWGS